MPMHQLLTFIQPHTYVLFFSRPIDTSHVFENKKIIVDAFTNQQVIPAIPEWLICLHEVLQHIDHL